MLDEIMAIDSAFIRIYSLNCNADLSNGSAPKEIS